MLVCVGKNQQCAPVFDDTKHTPAFPSEASHQPYEAGSEINVEAPVRLQDSQLPSALSYSYGFKFSLLRGRFTDCFFFLPTFILKQCPFAFLANRKTQSGSDARAEQLETCHASCSSSLSYIEPSYTNSHLSLFSQLNNSTVGVYQPLTAPRCTLPGHLWTRDTKTRGGG